MDLLFFEARLNEAIGNEGRAQGREPRVVWNRSDPLNHYNDTDFLRNYRLTKDSLNMLIDQHLGQELVFNSDRGKPLTPLQQVCVTLSWLATGSQMHTAGYLAGAKKNCAWATIHRTVDVICRHQNDFVNLPTHREMQETANYFQERYRIPRVCLGVDGSLITLGRKPCESQLPPGFTGQDFWSRKQRFGLNVQFVGDHRGLVRAIDPRWPGAVHDSRVWRNSTVKTWIERQTDFLIAGDSAYPISTTLLKPYHRPDSQKHRRFNKNLSGIRTICTEDIIGVVKARFPSFKKGFYTTAEFAGDCTIAAACMHNFAKIHNVPIPPEDEHNDDENETVIDAQQAHYDNTMNARSIRAAGKALRDTICNTYF